MATASSSQSRAKADMKIVILGDAAVGKTCFIQRYLKGSYAPEESTIGAAFSIKNWGGFNVAIWDTAGEERFRALSSFYCRDASAAILAYDVTRHKTIETLQSDFLQLLDRAKPNCLIVVVAMKMDLIEEREERQVTVEEGLELARVENMKRNTFFRANPDSIVNSFYETSSKTGRNVGEVFDFLQGMLLPSGGETKTKEDVDKKVISVSENENQGGDIKSGCCK